MRNLLLVLSLFVASNAFAEYYVLSEKADLENVTADWQAVVKNTRTSSMVVQAGQCEGTIFNGTLTERSVFLNSSQDKQEIDSLWFVGTAPAIKEALYDFSTVLDAGSITCSDNATGELKVYYKYRIEQLSALTDAAAMDSCLDDGACPDRRGRSLVKFEGAKSGNANNDAAAYYYDASSPNCSNAGGRWCGTGKRGQNYHAVVYDSSNYVLKNHSSPVRDEVILSAICLAAGSDVCAEDPETVQCPKWSNDTTPWEISCFSLYKATCSETCIFE